jgi:hypothetical protein
MEVDDAETVRRVQSRETVEIGKKLVIKPGKDSPRFCNLSRPWLLYWVMSSHDHRGGWTLDDDTGPDFFA